MGYGCHGRGAPPPASPAGCPDARLLRTLHRPWCYTTRPGKWGYCDCNGANPIGMEWRLGAWGNCSVKCGTGYQTRPVDCVNSTTGDVQTNKYLCGRSPAE